MFFTKKENFNKDILKEIYIKSRFKRYVELIIGILMLALSFNLFLAPTKLVFGGVSGISIITKEMFNWNTSIVIFVLSAILLLVSLVLLDKKQTAASVLGSILYPIFVSLTANIGNYIHVETDNLLLVAIFSGIMYGFGAGLVFKAGFTTGGTDILNQIVSKYFKVSMGNSLIIVDGLIVLSGAFVFGFTKLMYALIILYIISILTDKVLLGISDCKSFYVITDKEKEVKDFILANLNHGVTIFEARGGFTKEHQNVLMFVIPTKEYFKATEGIKQIDKDAFFVVTDAYQVFGGE